MTDGYYITLVLITLDTGFCVHGRHCCLALVLH